MKTFVQIALLLLLLVLIGAAGYWLYQNNANSQVSAQADGFSQTVAVQQGDLTATISVVGELHAPQNEEMSFDHLGETVELASMTVAAGHSVQTGQVLATIDPTTYQHALDQAKSDLQEAEKRLEDLQTPPSDLDIATADLNIARADLSLRQAQDNLQDLLDQDIADLEVALAEARLALAQAQEDLLELEIDTDTEDQIYELQEIEGERSAEYTRLAKERYTDSYYQDRLRVAYDDLLDAQDTLITTQVQQQANLHKAQMAVRQAEWDLADAQQALATARDGSDELDLATAQQAVAQAETDLASAQEEKEELEAGTDPVDLASAKADVEKYRLAVSEAEADLAGATMVAPFDGTVLKTNVEPGARIDASISILTIANLDELQVLASIDETTIRQVAKGQQVQITFDAFPGQTFDGEIVSIPLQGTLQGDVMIYEVPVSLQGAEKLPLRVGMTANAEIEVGQVTDALLIPTMALQNVGGFYQVLVANNRDPEASPEIVPIEVGLSNGIYTEVIRGLNAGDQVVVQMQGADNTPDFRAMRQMMGDGGGGPPRNRGN